MFYYTEQMLDPSLPGWMIFFLIIGVIAAFFSLILIGVSEWKEALICVTVAALMAVVVKHGPRETHLNEPVTATKVKYHDQSEQVSKSTSTMVGYVTYRVPDGEVSFRIGQGYVYHDNVILYKQVRK
jgi:hypothetical protein